MSQNRVGEVYENRKPREQWKDRYIYTILGLFGGVLGLHNFYLGRKKTASFQIFCSLLWIIFLVAGYAETALIFFSILLIWITADTLFVAHEPDGDRMNDEARPLRILLIVLFWLFFVLLPGGFLIFMKI